MVAVASCCNKDKAAEAKTSVCSSHSHFCSHPGQRRRRCCRVKIRPPATRAERGRMNETLSDSHEVTHMVYVVISASLHPVFSHFVLFPHRPSLFLPPLLRCLCPRAADTPHQRCCHSDRGHMLYATSTKSKKPPKKQEMHPKGGTRTCTVTAVCKCLSVICKKEKKTLQVHLHKRSTRMHHEEERGCVVHRCHRISLTAADKQI